MTVDETSLGRTIRSARERDGLSLRQLASEARISPAQLSRIERDDARRPSIATVARIAGALRRSPYILLVLGGQVPLEEIRPAVDRTLPQIAAALGRTRTELETLLAETGSLDEGTDAARELRSILAHAFVEATDADVPIPALAELFEGYLAPSLGRHGFPDRLQGRPYGEPAPAPVERPEASRDFRALREEWHYLSPGRRELLRALAADQRRLSELERLESPSTQRRLDRVRALEEEVAALRDELERWQRSSRELEARTAHLEEQLARARVRNEATDDDSPERPANERID